MGVTVLHLSLGGVQQEGSGQDGGGEALEEGAAIVGHVQCPFASRSEGEVSVRLVVATATRRVPPFATASWAVATSGSVQRRGGRWATTAVVVAWGAGHDRVMARQHVRDDRVTGCRWLDRRRRYGGGAQHGGCAAGERRHVAVLAVRHVGVHGHRDARSQRQRERQEEGPKRVSHACHRAPPAADAWPRAAPANRGATAR